ncbi:hypothetical protein [Clostridium sp. C2-6-12]|uniref:hypothetical protein n=1 Tax=Clostridium sp. C2-6-12 TaxID=2698832 RepID=UPI00136E4C96|nr:hypothetical protein [Clostridium sp. C2-6-12]
MLKLTAIEFILRAIPEGFVFIFACYALSENRVNMKRYVASSLLFAISVYLIRSLPINYGVHTILSIIIETIIIISICKINIVLAVKSSIIATICLFVIELFNMLVLKIIFKEQLDAIMVNPAIRTIYGMPSLLIFAIITLSYYLRKKDRLKNV